MKLFYIMSHKSGTTGYISLSQLRVVELTEDERMEVTTTIPDLIPHDFYLWGHLKAKVYAVKVRNIEHLQERTVTACRDNIPQAIHGILLG
jgi:hypothetical protein